MYGNGAAGPPPPRGATTVITLRVLFAAAGFLTCGLLSCIPLFRVAVLRGGRLDWTLAWLSLPVSIGCLAVVGSLPETDGRTDAAMAALLLIGAAAAAHFLVVDLRLHAARPPFPGYQPYPAPGPHYAQTQPAVGPYGPALAPQTPPPHGPGPAPAGYRTPPQTPPPRPAAPRPPVAGTPVPQPPGPAGMPQPPAPARIDQVRAELDELSDYLRRHDGGGSANGRGEGGR